ncbi:MAG: hypothetical protein RR904_04580 [Bacilli bacterium]
MDYLNNYYNNIIISLEKWIKKQKIVEQKIASCNSLEEYQTNLIDINDAFSRRKCKIAEMKIMSFVFPDREAKYMNIVTKILRFSKLAEDEKFKIMISAGSLIYGCKAICTMDDDKVVVLAGATEGMYTENIKDYLAVLTDDSLMNSIVKKTSDYGKRVELIYAVMDNIDKQNLNNLSKTQAANIVVSSINEISKYKFKTKPLIVKGINNKI